MKVLVLGTVHFGDSSDYYRTQWGNPTPKDMEGLVEYLATYDFGAVFVESPAPWEWALLKDTYGDESAYMDLATRLQKDLAVGWFEAYRKSDALLKEGDLKGAVEHLLAAYDLPSAVLNWARLGDREKGTLREDVREYLNGQRPNEIDLIAVPLALRLGHVRLYGADAFVEDVPEHMTDALIETFKRLDSEGKFKKIKEIMDKWKVLYDKSFENEDLLGFFLHINSKDSTDALEEQWRVLSEYGGVPGRLKVRSWLARNMKMASYVLKGMAHIPAERALVLVGVSHKGPLEKLLATAGVEILKLEGEDDGRYGR